MLPYCTAVYFYFIYLAISSIRCFFDATIFGQLKIQTRAGRYIKHSNVHYDSKMQIIPKTT